MATNLATKHVEDHAPSHDETVKSPHETTEASPPTVEPPHKVVESSEVEASAPATAQRPEELRLLEAMLFASTEPLDTASLAKRLPDGADVKSLLEQLQADYAMRGVNLVRVANKWTFRTAADLSRASRALRG